MIRKQKANRAICEGDKATIEVPGLYEIMGKLAAMPAQQVVWLANNAMKPDWRRAARLLNQKRNAPTPPPAKQPQFRFSGDGG